MIEIQDLQFSYDEGDFLLQVPELAVAQGETVAIVGPSGSGKTTLLNLIAGTAIPRSGQVTTNGRKVSGLACMLQLFLVYRPAIFREDTH